MAILQLDVRPWKGERRTPRAQRRAATGPNVDLPRHDARLDAHRNGNPPAASDDPPIWQQVVWKLSRDTEVGPAINAATQRLEEAHITTARLDAQVLLAHVLGVDRSWLFAHYEHVLTEEQADQFMDLVVRRVAHEPVAYLVNHKEFYGIDLYVDPHVLIPRPETEMLVDQVLAEIAIRHGQRLIIADVGTGSGAIALAVAANAPNTHIYALDISANALAVAQRNVARYAMGEQITLVRSDLLAKLPMRADIVVANLPYVTNDDYVMLEPDVHNYEPKGALVGGPLGLDLITRLLRQLPRHVTPDAFVALEIGYNQGAAVIGLVETLLPQATQVELHRDYQGHDRVVTFQL
ncbi:MAG TPA: peptide chain release factor N(5)-glutamine methyltransferase [Chloroflexi bacterium]|nr:peptide chain release factor N(5)-glutamine methyltransferase [Chloroflexota bacterium]